MKERNGIKGRKKTRKREEIKKGRNRTKWRKKGGG